MASKVKPDDRPSIAKELLARGHSPDTAARLFADKVEHRPVYLRVKSPPPVNARSARRLAREREKARQKQRPRPLSARELRRRGLHDVPREGQRYDVFAPLHSLWLGYAREILGSDLYGGNAASAAAKLASADFHGAEVEVSRSGCPSRVGVKGIVVKDSRFVFEVVTRGNKVKILPKEGTMFRIEIPPARKEGEEEAGQEQAKPFVFEILGEQFRTRAADRANRKYKTHFLKKI